MMNEETVNKMLAMRLCAMAEAFRELAANPGDDLSFCEKVGLMIDREHADRENRRLHRLSKSAQLSMPACLEDVFCSPGRGLSRSVLRDLGQGQWITAKQNVIVIGATGVGKSYLGCALCHLACRRGHRALFRRVPRLLQELSIARLDGSYPKVLSRLSKVEVLVLDDFLINPLSDVERRDLLEVLEDRYDRVSTVLTSQLPTKKWHQALSDPTMADAICDRVVHNAHVLNLKGPSMREKKGLGGKKKS